MKEVLFGFQTGFLIMLKQGKKMPPRSKWPVTIRIVMDALRDTEMIKIVEGQAHLTAEGHQIADKLIKTQQRASDNLKSVPEEQIQEDMRAFLSIGLRELRKEFPAKVSGIDAVIPEKWGPIPGKWEPISKEMMARMSEWKPPTAADD